MRHAFRLTGRLIAFTLLGASLCACAQTPSSATSAFNNINYSDGSQQFGVYVPSQGRSIMSSLNF